MYISPLFCCIYCHIYPPFGDFLKVLEKCAKKLIGYSRLALNNLESNIDF